MKAHLRPWYIPKPTASSQAVYDEFFARRAQLHGLRGENRRTAIKALQHAAREFSTAILHIAGCDEGRPGGPAAPPTCMLCQDRAADRLASDLIAAHALRSIDRRAGRLLDEETFRAESLDLVEAILEDAGCGWPRSQCPLCAAPIVPELYGDLRPPAYDPRASDRSTWQAASDRYADSIDRIYSAANAPIRPPAAIPAPVLPTLDHPTHLEPHQNRRESGASSLQPLAAVSAILTTLALTAALQRPTPAGRHYHPIPLAQIARAAPGDPIVPTHVVTSGTVRLVRQEADGDLHVRLCAPADPRVCIVLECIPELPCKAPRYGDHVTAQGISRWDTAHRWQEIHPALSLEVDK